MSEVASLTAKVRIDGVEQAKQQLKSLEKRFSDANAAAYKGAYEVVRANKVATQNIRDSVNEQIMTNKQQAAAFRRNTREMIQGVVQFGAAAAAVGIAGKKIYEFGKAGATLEYTKVKFDRLAASVGTTGDVFRKNLLAATKGTLSEFDAMGLGANVLQLGLAKNADEAVRLSKVMTGLGMDVGEVSLALANQSTRRLDQLGLSLVKFKQIQEQLKGKGLSKEDMFTEAFLQTAEETIKITGNMADESIGQFKRMEAAWTDLVNTMKIGASGALAQTASDIGMFASGMRQLISGATVMDWGAVFGGGQSWVRNISMGEQEKTFREKYKIDQFQRETLTGRGGARVSTNLQTDDERLARAQLKGALATEYYSQQYKSLNDEKQNDIDITNEQIGITDEQLKLSFQLTAQNKQYEDALEQIDKAFGGVTSTTNAYTVQSNELKKQYESGKLSLKEYNSEQGKLDKNLQNGKNNLDDVIVKFKNTEYVAKLFNEQVQELNMSLRDGSITQQEYARSISQLNTEYSNGTFAAKEQKKAVDDVKQAQLDAAESSVSALLEQAGAENLVQQEWALATGQITQDGFEQAQAIDAISKAIAGGMGAEEAAAKLKIIIDQIKFLDGKTFTTFMDIVITGDVPIPPARAGQGGGRWGGEVTDEVPLDKGHSGGQLAGNWTLVGDAPGGRLTPYSELISPSGYVYNAQQTRTIMQSGRISPVSRAFGDLDNTIPAPSLIKKSTLPALSKGISGKINPSTGETVIEQIAQVSEASMESLIVPIISSMSQQTSSQMQVQILKTAESIRETKKTNKLLEAILYKVASDRGIAYAVSEERYKNS